MSSIKRISTEVLKRQGIQKVTVVAQSRLVDKFTNGLGGDRSPDPSNIYLNDTSLLPAYINANDYFRARDYFLQNGSSASNAESMAMLANDMALTLDVSVASFLYNNSGDGVLMALQDYALMNVYRPTNNRVSALTTGTNKNCLRKRDIIA